MEKCVDTTFFGRVCDSGDGASILMVLRTIIDVMTVGISILAVIGITICGVQYLTAKGSEDQVKKAKRRILEIVIGLAAYVLIYAVLSWLLPNFNY